MRGSRRRERAVSGGSVALVALMLLAVGVILVPALASLDPSRIHDVLARRLVPDVLADWAFCFAMGLHPGK